MIKFYNFRRNKVLQKHKKDEKQLELEKIYQNIRLYREGKQKSPNLNFAEMKIHY